MWNKSIFGIIGSKNAVLKAREWMNFAIADGWKARPTYQNEPMDSACSLSKDGFTASVIAREKTNGAKSNAIISIWGPDGLSVKVPDIYDWIAIQKNANVCSNCNKEGQTVRLAFANRVCPECKEKLKPKYEYAGWDR